MKKVFYFVLAAAAIVASCAKENLTETVNPSGETTALFSASIIQPNGLDGATKVSIVDDPDTDNKVFINWDSGDKILVLPCGRTDWHNAVALFAVDASANTDFTGDIPEQSDNYTARYFGPDDVWKDYVLGSNNNIFVNTINPVALQNMPLYCVQSTRNGGRNYLQFSCEYAILQVNVPSKLEYDNLYVCVDDQGIAFKTNGTEGGITETSTYTLCVKDAGKIQPETGQDYVKIFVPIPADQYDKITLFASKGTEANESYVAFMQTYDVGVDVTVESNTIYFFDFCNTLTISAAGDYTLESSNGINYKVNIAGDITGNVTINAEVEGKEPANIYINNRGHLIDGTLTINASKSHVEGENGVATQVEANTSNSTFVVKPTLSITGLTVKKGSVVVEGTADKKANVATITIPSEVTEQIKIDVTGISADETNRVEIVNNSTTPVVVVPDNVENQQSYKVTGGGVTPVSKTTVAKIGDAEYETLAAAISAASAGQTITLVSNIALDKEITISKGITIDGNNFTIAVSDDEYWNQYKVGGANQGLGKVNMITVKADNFTLKNVTLDGKDCRGVSLCTTKSGENVRYQNITYTGRGSGHYYGEATGLVTFDGCKFDIHGYAVHFGGESSVDDDVVINNCEVNGWSSFGFCKSLTITDSHFGGANDEGKNGWLAVLRPYCPTTITNCTFSDIYLHEPVTGYDCIGLGTGAATTVTVKGCKIVNGSKQEITGAEIYSIVRDNGFDNQAAQNGSVFAFDATGDATDGYTAGTFYAVDPTKIKLQSGYEYYAIEGKTNIYGVREGQSTAVAKIGTTTYETLEAAFAAATAGQTIEIVKAGTYTLPSPISNLTIKGVDGVEFNAMKEYGQSVSLLHDVKFESVKFIFGSNNYTGFQHSESVTFTKCVFDGKFNSYGTMLFDQCTFNSPEGDYSMWCYAGNVTYKNCTINCKGKFANVYNEGNALTDDGGNRIPWKVVAEGCTFNSTKANKAAFNIKATCGTTPLYYDVEIKNCTANGTNWPEASTSETLVVGSALWQVDDIKTGVASKIKVTVDDTVVYTSPAIQ